MEKRITITVSLDGQEVHRNFYLNPDTKQWEGVVEDMLDSLTHSEVA